MSKGLEELARNYCSTENEITSIEDRKKKIFSDLLEAEDLQKEKQIEKLKVQLSEVNRDLEIKKNSLSGLKKKMTDQATAEFQDQTNNFKKTKKKLDEEIRTTEMKLAELIANAIVYAKSLGMGEIEKKLGGLFSVPGYLKNSPENLAMISRIAEAQKTVQSPDNYHERKSDLRIIKNIIEQPSMIPNHVNRIVMRTLGAVRRQEL